MFDKKGKEGACKLCGKTDTKISKVLGVCLSCIRRKPEEAIEIAKEVHRKVREEFNLPGEPPRTEGGFRCNVCANECQIGLNEMGYCGLRRNVNGKLESLEGIITMYYDPLPTNCCASWFCSGSKKRGYNLAVFPYGCSFNCLFCQNWEHKYINPRNKLTLKDLVEASGKATCICYFGGTPEPQLPFLLKATKEILEERNIMICWEWNGTGNPDLVKKAVEYSYESGGTVKFDLKAFDENLNIALTGRPNSRVLDNFEMVAREFDKKNFLNATTLLVPGYIDKEEVEKIAKFISSLDPDIPYSLLAFHPDFKMLDMPVTTRKQAYECYEVAKKYLRKVNIGNVFLLW